jgi:hypothetical protein
MKKILFSLGAFLAVSMTGHAQITIDPFTDPDSVTYNYYNAFNGTPTTPGSLSDFGSVSGGIWFPGGNGQNVGNFVVNNGSIQVANIGDSVSLSINLGSSLDHRALGLVLSDSLTPSASVSQVDMLFQRTAEGYDLVNVTNPDGNTADQTDYSTLTLTKTAVDTFSASVTGGGVTAFSTTFTFAGTNDYVGLGTFANFNGLGGVTATNFVLNPASVPEPGAPAMFGLGLFALLGLALRRKIA